MIYYRGAYDMGANTKWLSHETLKSLKQIYQMARSPSQA